MWGINSRARGHMSSSSGARQRPTWRARRCRRAPRSVRLWPPLISFQRCELEHLMLRRGLHPPTNLSKERPCPRGYCLLPMEFRSHRRPRWAQRHSHSRMTRPPRYRRRTQEGRRSSAAAESGAAVRDGVRVRAAAGAGAPSFAYQTLSFCHRAPREAYTGTAES